MHHLPKLIRVVLLALLVITPWFFGGVWARVQWVVMLIAAILLAIDLVTRFSDDDRPHLVPAAWLPPLFGILLGLFHLIPWPASWAETMAPATVAWRAELIENEPHAGAALTDQEGEIDQGEVDQGAEGKVAEGDDGDQDQREAGAESDFLATGDSPAGAAASTQAVAPPDNAVRRSIYAVVTREHLALLVLAAGVFVLASSHLMDKQSSLWFFAALGICGAVMSFFGLVQRLSWNGKFYWIFEPLAGGFQSFGPFVNRNNAGGFLNLCLAAGIGLLIWVHWNSTGAWAGVFESHPSGRQRDHRSRDRSRSSRGSRRSGSSRSGSGRSRHRSSRSSREQHDSTTSSHTDSTLERVEPDRLESETARQMRNAGDETHAAADSDNRQSSPSSSANDAADAERPANPSSVESELAKAYRESRQQAAAAGEEHPDEALPFDHDTTGKADGRESFPTSQPSESESGRPRSGEARARDPGSGEHRSGSHRPTSASHRSGSHADHHRRYGMAANPLSYESGGNKVGAESWQGLQEMARGYIAELNATRLWSLAIVGLTAGGVLSTASRGSILAMFVAAIVTIAALAVRQGSRGLAAGLLVMLVAGVGLMNWAGQTEFVKSRFEMMFEQEQYETGRVPNWIEALRSYPEFPIAGSGLGTYRLVYERFQERFVRDTVHMYAENQFVQALVEGGIIALLLLVAVIILTGLAIHRLFVTGGPVNTALAVAGTFGLSSQLVGGLFDFGLYIPSNTILMAALCGMLIGRAALLSVWPPESLDALDQPGKRSEYTAGTTSGVPGVPMDNHLSDDRQTVIGKARSRRSVRTRRGAGEPRRNWLLGLPAPPSVVTVIVGFLLLGSLFGSLEMNRAARIEQAMRQSRLVPLAESASPDKVAAASAPLRNTLPQRWDDAEAHLHLAQLFLLGYQSQTYETLLKQRKAAERQSAAEAEAAAASGDAEGEAGSDASASASASAVEDAEPEPRDEELWSRASLFHLHTTIDQLQQNDKLDEIARLRSGSLVEEYLRPASRHLIMARQFAPTMPQTHYLLAELSEVIPELDDERIHLARAQLLSPGNATIWYWSGMLHLSAGRADDACAAFLRSLEQSPLHLDEIMVAAQGKLTVRQLLDQTLPPQADMLLHVARKFFAGEERTRFRMAFLQRAEEALDRTELPPAELAYTNATILNLSGRGSEAMPFYENAILRRSNEYRWRYEYAQMLYELEEYDKAREHTQYLLQQFPENTVYQRLNRQIISKQVRNPGT